ncbi:MAG: M28 family peptidase [Chitinophagales bacterium]|nr:M28 family peptidase [Chitinophagales bacterium]HAE12848.1 peptidase M28 family protein [Bacteroidota bacterium]MCB9018916.1 M28 family peptidase [Chitinophagales bacterium]MCB9022594.1 M28 family peptidase [Chitinophagales bacterium]HPE97115.1 M28 family peptidase [Chitinophagales bacterium]
MKKIAVALVLAFSFYQAEAQNYADSVAFRKIFNEVLTNGECYDWLHDLCKDVGHRLSGSPQADMAVRWGEAVMREAGFDSVWLQPVMVPKWVRGQKEYAEILGVGQVDVLALGGSIATPTDGITAQVVYAETFDDLEKLGREKIAGRIVFFNEYFDPTNINTFESYGQCVPYRWKGASEAAKYGAAAVVIRSVGSAYDDFPHTGSMRYLDPEQQIPAVALSTMDADVLKEALQQNADLQFRLVTYSQTLEMVPSFNVIGELRGTTYPDEVLVVGGHLDSWDVGEGAHDDGAGCVQSMEVLRTLRASMGQPKRTVRCVLFMNEENGVKGGHAYADWAGTTGQKNLFAMESDAGGFTPRGFSLTDSAYVSYFQGLKPLFEPYNIHYIEYGYGGTDIHPLEDHGTLMAGLVPDSQRYMDYHHTENDIFEHVNKRELELGAGTMACLVWYISEYGLPVH